jgi:hypothetical protein
MVPRADFKPEQFDILVQQKGYKAIWEKGMFCPCYALESGQPDYSCSECGGKGYVYFDPQEIRVLVTSISGRKEQEHIGLNELGTAYMTPTSKDQVGFRDRFTFPDFRMKFSQLVTNVGTTDTMRYNVKEMIAVRSKTTVFKVGVDYRIVGDRGLEWIYPAVSEGQQYSVLYMTTPVYIAINPIHELRGTYTMYKERGNEVFVELPKQFQIKREDFIDDQP